MGGNGTPVIDLDARLTERAERMILGENALRPCPRLQGAVS